MKMILIFVSAFFLQVSAMAQNARVEIVAEKITYQRKGAKIPEHKKTFEVRYPRVSGDVSTAVLKNINETISYWKNFETTLEENLKSEFWLTNLDYKVAYNKNFFLVIDLIMEGSGAYPDSTDKTLVVDLKTGQRVFLNQAFRNIPGLLLKIDREQKTEVRYNIAKLKREGEAKAATDLKRLVRRSRISVSKLEEFSISDAGVVFIYDYGFPHAVKALEPRGKYLFSWRDLRSHIKRDGLLAKFLN